MFKKQKQGEFPVLMQPPPHAGWWFWGAMGLGIGIWACGIKACTMLL